MYDTGGESEWDVTDLRGWEGLYIMDSGRGYQCQTDYHCCSVNSFYQDPSCFPLQLSSSPSFIPFTSSTSSSPSTSRACRDIKKISAEPTQRNTELVWWYFSWVFVQWTKYVLKNIFRWSYQHFVTACSRYFILLLKHLLSARGNSWMVCISDLVWDLLALSLYTTQLNIWTQNYLH